MKVIRQRDFPATFAYTSTASEATASYSSTTTYSAGSKVLYPVPGTTYAIRMYQALSTTTGDQPDISPLKWVDIGPSNQWAMFDGQVATQSTASTSMTVTVTTGAIDSLAFAGLTGSSLSVTVTDGPSGPTIYSGTTSLDNSVVVDAYTYCFEPFVQKTEAVFDLIPQYSTSVVTLTITGGTVGIGHMMFGNEYYLGEFQYGATVAIIDYSKKETDEFGITTFVKRAFSKRITGSMEIPKASVNKLFSTLSGMRATPAMWIGVDDSELGSLTVYGYYKDFTINVAYPYHSLCSLEIEGLT